MIKLDSMNATHRPARVVPGHLVWPAAAIVALAGAARALAALTGLPMPGNSGPSTASASTRSSSTVSSSSSSSSSSGMVAAGRTASAAGSAAAAKAAPASTHAAPATVRVAAAPAPSARTSSPAVTPPAVLGRGQHTFIAAMTRAQPGASRQSPSQAVASNGGGREGGASGGTDITRTPSSVSASSDAHGADPRGVAIPSYQPPPGAERRHPMSNAARVGPGAGSDAPTSGSASTAPAPDPSSSTQSHSPNRFAAGAGPTPDNASSTSSAPTRAAAAGAVTDTTARSATRTAAAEARPAPLAEIVPTAAEWSDARRQASAARVVPLSQTQTLSGGATVARTADCVPTTLVPDAKRPGQLSIGHSSRDLARSVSTTQDVARLFARTRFDGVDLGVSQSMCLPPDLAGRLAQLPPTTGLAARPAMTLRAGKSRVEPATGAAG